MPEKKMAVDGTVKVKRSLGKLRKLSAKASFSFGRIVNKTYV